MAITRGTEIDLGLLTELAGSKANASRILNATRVRTYLAQGSRPDQLTDENLLTLYTDGDLATGLRKGSFQDVFKAPSGIGMGNAQAIEKYLLERKVLAYDHRFQHLPVLDPSELPFFPNIVEIGELSTTSDLIRPVYTIGLLKPQGNDEHALCYGTTRIISANAADTKRANLRDILSYRTIAPFKGG